MEERCAINAGLCWVRNFRPSESYVEYSRTWVGNGRVSVVIQSLHPGSIFDLTHCYVCGLALGVTSKPLSSHSNISPI